jgi:hypothetical protein
MRLLSRDPLASGALLLASTFVVIAVACGGGAGDNSLPFPDSGADAPFDATLCGPGTTQCGATCTVLQFDPNNCGQCGRVCAQGQSCDKGACGLDCNGGSTQCSGACVDVANDPANCGKCGASCPLGQVCSGGQCDLFCNGSTTKCDDKCVDTESDPNDCGQCNDQCQQGLVCYQGACAAKCGGSTQQCGQACVDVEWDPANCGACGNACGASQVCSQGTCQSTCGANRTKCGNDCADTSTDVLNCGQCGAVCKTTDQCIAGKCTPCDSSTTDCDGDGWKVSDNDCCDKPGTCGSEPKLVNPGAIEVVGNGIDDNCNGLVDLFDTVDTAPCDKSLASNSQAAMDYVHAIGQLCRSTTLNAPLPQKTWGVLDAQLVRADGTSIGDWSGLSIRPGFGNVIVPLNGVALAVLSNGTAADATQTNPGPNGGAPAGTNVSYADNPASAVDISGCNDPNCVKDWFIAANPPLKQSNELPAAPNCGGQINAPNTANDSAMLVISMRAPTNARAFSFNSFFLSAEYPEYVCTNYNDQYVALVDTPNGTPSPIANPVDKNLMTFLSGGMKYPVAINIAGQGGTSLFSVCDVTSQSAACMGTQVNAMSCSLGIASLAGTGFEAPAADATHCIIGGGTYWLTTAGNVIPGDVVTLRIAVWDVSDAVYDSLALVDGFQWLANATLPGTN